MNYIVSIEHPAWVHQFKYVIKHLQELGHNVKVVALDKDVTLYLLEKYNIHYKVFSNTAGKNILEKFIVFFRSSINLFRICLTFKPDVFFGRASPMMSLMSFIFGKDHFVFSDTEHSTTTLLFARIFSTLIFTPKFFKKNLGYKHIRLDTFKELFYLHPNRFKPDPTVQSEFSLERPYVLLRLVTWSSHHDYNQHGLLDPVSFVDKLSKTVRIVISSEEEIHSGLKKYQLNFPPEKLHDLLSSATLYIGEGGTTATEAAVLGVGSIHISTKAKYIGNFSELAELGLMWIFEDQNRALNFSLDLLQKTNILCDIADKSKKVMSQKIDGSDFFVWLLGNYPYSVKFIEEYIERKQVVDDC